MIALLTTYLVVAFFLIPGVIFRFIAGLFVRLRLFQLSKTQEFTVGVLAAVLPLCFANISVWCVPYAQQYPCPYEVGSYEQYRSDYKLALSLLVAQDPQKLLDPHQGPKTSYEEALSRLWRRHVRFLTWFVAFTALEGVLYGVLAKKYGDWYGKNKFYDYFAVICLRPYVSEWELLLTDFTLPKHPKRNVIADVLCEEVLYRGKVSDFYLDKNGMLSGLFLEDAERFYRDGFKSACAQAKNSVVKLYAPDGLDVSMQTEWVDSDNFWRKIPGDNFYIPASQISNLNIHFPSENPLEDKELAEYLSNLLGATDLPLGVTYAFDKSTSPNTAISPNS
jgi:hypothetical protein